MLARKRLPLLAATSFVLFSMTSVGCTEGAYDDPQAQLTTPPPPTSGDGGNNGGDEMDCAVFFAQRVQPELEYCRSCHVPEGVADVDDGRGLQFTSNSEDDLERLYQGWETLGGNNPQSRILTMASGTDEESHSGGDPWPVDSAIYADVETLLNGFENGWCEAALAEK